MDSSNYLVKTVIILDLLMPGLIAYMSGLIITNRKNLLEYGERYNKISVRFKVFYIFFSIVFLLVMFFMMNKKYEVGFLLKLITTIFNIITTLYTTVQVFGISRKIDDKEIPECLKEKCQ